MQQWQNQVIVSDCLVCQAKNAKLGYLVFWKALPVVGKGVGTPRKRGRSPCGSALDPLHICCGLTWGICGTPNRGSGNISVSFACF